MASARNNGTSVSGYTPGSARSFSGLQDSPQDEPRSLSRRAAISLLLPLLTLLAACPGGGDYPASELRVAVTPEEGGAGSSEDGLVSIEVPPGAVEGKVTVTAAPKEDLEEMAVEELVTSEQSGLTAIDVKVENMAAGHNLPTSLTELRQMWLDVRAEDADGIVFWRSGAIDDSGAIDPSATIFNSLAVDVDGEPTLKPSRISHFEHNKTIPPKGFAIQRYIFATPEHAKQPITVRAALNYRSFDQAVADELFGEDAPRVPVVLMTEGQLELD